MEDAGVLLHANVRKRLRLQLGFLGVQGRGGQTTQYPSLPRCGGEPCDKVAHGDGVVQPLGRKSHRPFGAAFWRHGIRKEGYANTVNTVSWTLEVLSRVQVRRGGNG